MTALQMGDRVRFYGSRIAYSVTRVHEDGRVELDGPVGLHHDDGQVHQPDRLVRETDVEVEQAGYVLTIVEGPGAADVRVWLNTETGGYSGLCVGIGPDLVAALHDSKQALVSTIAAIDQALISQGETR